MINSKLQTAILYTNAYHYGQFRSDNVTPYVNHIQEVVKQLKQWWIYDDNMLVTACLHDTLERTSLTEKEIYNVFGKDILDQVKLITFDPNKMTEKEYYHLNRNNIIKLADHLTNTIFFAKNHIVNPEQYYEKGIELVNNFSKTIGCEKTIRYVEEII